MKNEECKMTNGFFHSAFLILHLVIMTDKIILLVEDNPSDEVLTLRALKKNNLANEVVVAHDGVEALDYLFRTSGVEVLRRIRADARMRLLPVIMLTSSLEERDVALSYANGTNSYVRKPVDFVQFVEAIRQLGLYWLVLNVAAPIASQP
jgi:two-component system response regulator